MSAKVTRHTGYDLLARQMDGHHAETDRDEHLAIADALRDRLLPPGQRIALGQSSSVHEIGS